MKEFWSARIRDAVPYTPGEQPRDRKFIKLNTNECPYPPSTKVLEAVRAAADENLRLYPDPECLDLRRAIARREGLSEDQVFCSNGSDEVLAFAFQAFFDPDREVVFPRITYSFYPVYTSYFGLKCRRVPMNPDFPDVVVIVDEAYVDFGAQSAVPLIDKYPNLLVVQTASKSRALAGLRVGWAMGHQNLIHGLRCVRDSINSYTVDRLAQAGLRAAIEDEDYFQSIRRRVMDTRAWTVTALKEMGFTVLPSQANFLFVSRPGRSGKELLDGLRARGVLVRWWADEPIRDWLRVSIGTDEEMRALVGALKELI